jgi:lysophospholipase L1-like esterase
VPVAARLRRAVVALLAAACAVPLAGCDGSAGATPDATGTSQRSAAPPATYLALGDSVPFGFRGGADFSKAANFVGYPELVGERRGLRVINASCPGETTASFLDETAQSNGCENSPTSKFGYRTGFPLHVLYDSVDESQLEFAVRTLQRTKDVSLVTVQIGANDAFLCQHATADGCLSEIGSVARTVQANLDRILAALRGEGGYSGRIVVVTYYALDYSTPQAGGIRTLDAGITAAARAHGAEVADGFGAFRPAAERAGGDPQAAGLVLPRDVHPTARGQQLLADAVEKALG